MEDWETCRWDDLWRNLRLNRFCEPRNKVNAYFTRLTLRLASCRSASQLGTLGSVSEYPVYGQQVA
jgi:hypothetical protein